MFPRATRQEPFCGSGLPSRTSSADAPPSRAAHAADMAGGGRVGRGQRVPMRFRSAETMQGNVFPRQALTSPARVINWPLDRRTHAPRSARRPPLVAGSSLRASSLRSAHGGDAFTALALCLRCAALLAMRAMRWRPSKRSTDPRWRRG